MKSYWEIAKLGLILMLVSAVSAGALSVTYAVTKDRIASQKKLEELKAVMRALPGARSPRDLAELPREAARAARIYPDVAKIFRAGKESAPTGYCVQVVPRGFGGPILMAVGITPDGEVAGVAVISHRETPGLGSGAAEPRWLAQFRGKGARDPLVVGEDIDAVSGATRSSKAVTAGVREALEVYRRLLEGR